MAWDRNGVLAFFSAFTSQDPQPLSNTIFTAHFLAIEDGVASSRITTEPYRVNRSLNGTIKCRNTISPDGNGTVSENITINVTGRFFVIVNTWGGVFLDIVIIVGIIFVILYYPLTKSQKLVLTK